MVYIHLNIIEIKTLKKNEFILMKSLKSNKIKIIFNTKIIKIFK